MQVPQIFWCFIIYFIKNPQIYLNSQKRNLNIRFEILFVFVDMVELIVFKGNILDISLKHSINQKMLSTAIKIYIYIFDIL